MQLLMIVRIIVSIRPGVLEHLTLLIYCGLPQKRSAAVHIYFQINLMVEREGMAVARSK